MAKRNDNPQFIKVLTPFPRSDVFEVRVPRAFEKVTADLRTLLKAVYEMGKKDGARPLSQSMLKHICKTEGFEIEIRKNGKSAVKASGKIALLKNLGSSLLSERSICPNIKQLAPSIGTVVQNAANDVSRNVPKSAREVVVFGSISVDFSKMETRRNGERVFLTAKEFRTLKFLTQNAERVITRDELLNEVWGYQNYPTTRTVDTHILRLRRKLETDPANPIYFRTVHGVGYRFVRSASS